MRKILITALLIIFFSCTDKNSVPSGIIKPAQMQDLFWDMIRSDVLAREMVKKDSTQNIKSEAFALTEKIFALHHTDRVKFEKSLAYYEKHPALMKTVFDSLSTIQSRRHSANPEKK